MSPVATPSHGLVARPPETLAEHFWSLARHMDPGGDSAEPSAVVRHVLAVLDALDAGRTGNDVTVSTLSFLALLRQQEVRGDLLYASPEQARGEEMDERSLVFSVGVLLFEKLTGRHPFGAENNPNRIARIRKGEIASGVNFFPRVPSGLRSMLVKAMGPFPEERWRNLGELRAQLEDFLANEIDDGPTAIRHLPAVGQVDDDARTRVVRVPQAAVSGQTRAAPPRRRTQSVIVEPETATSSRARASVVIDTTPRPPLPIEVHDAARARAGRATEQIPRPSLSRRARPAWLLPAVYMTAGAIVASAAMLTTAGGGREQRRADLPAAALPARPAPQSLAALGAPTAPPPAAAAVSKPAVFDIDAAGDAALAAVRDCFTATRLAGEVRFGASLVFGAKDGISHKIYFGADVDLAHDERVCLLGALTGISAGGAPGRPSVAVYMFELDAQGGGVSGRLE